MREILEVEGFENAAASKTANTLRLATN